MSGSLVPRDICVICGGAGLRPIVGIDGYPVFQGCVTFPQGPDECEPMQWAVCAACGGAQITALPPLERIYQAGHATGLGGAWARHHKAFADFIRLHADGRVVDVGGGSGTLAVAYRRSGGTAPWMILEPNALRTPDLPDDIDVIDGFLDNETLRQTGAGTVVLCHMLEHVVDLRGALKTLSEVLPDDGKILVAWPELERWVENGLAGALNFEHGIYLTVPQLVAVFAEFGWHVSGNARWEENDTRFLALSRGAPSAGRLERASHDATAAIKGYFARFVAQADALSHTLRDHDGDAFLMPASIYVQALLAAGLSQARFASVLDNARAKQGRRLYGTNLKVVAPEAALADARDPVVVLNGGAHDAEIARGLRDLRSDVRILTPGQPECVRARA